MKTKSNMTVKDKEKKIKVGELSTEYALLKGLSSKNYEQLKRLRELEIIRLQK